MPVPLPRLTTLHARLAVIQDESHQTPSGVQRDPRLGFHLIVVRPPHVVRILVPASPRRVVPVRLHAFSEPGIGPLIGPVFDSLVKRRQKVLCCWRNLACLCSSLTKQCPEPSSFHSFAFSLPSPPPRLHVSRIRYLPSCPSPLRCRRDPRCASLPHVALHLKEHAGTWDHSCAREQECECRDICHTIVGAGVPGAWVCATVHKAAS